MVYVIFSTNDLCSWKTQNPSFSEKPQVLISLLNTVFYTHWLTWDNWEQFLDTLSMVEEQDKIHLLRSKVTSGPDIETLEDIAACIESSPSIKPDWDSNTDEGKETLDSFLQALLERWRQLL